MNWDKKVKKRISLLIGICMFLLSFIFGIALGMTKESLCFWLLFFSGMLWIDIAIWYYIDIKIDEVK